MKKLKFHRICNPDCLISMYRMTLIGMLLIACCHIADAQSDARPITSIYGIETGGSNVTSTYQSPLPYTGWTLGIFGGWGKAMKQHPENMIMEFRANIEMSRNLNPAKTALMWGGSAGFSWGMAWRKCFAHNLEINLGGAADITGGGLYLPRNGNNPVGAIASLSLDITGALQWKTRLGKLPVTLADRVMLPTAGVFFMPGYGESYYEIYLGNRENLAHFGWWGNAFGINNHLTFTLHFGKKALQIGYRLGINTYHANNLTIQYVRNAFTLAYRIN